MFNSTVLREFFMSLLGWRAHFDTEAITIDADLLNSDSGEYFQDFNPALRLDFIQSILSDKQEINEYLREKMQSAITGMFNDLITKRQVSKYGKTLLEQSTLLNRYAWSGDRIVNLGRFVGFQIQLRDVSGLQAIINEIGIQLDGEDEIPLFLFHSSQLEPLEVFTMTTLSTSQAWRKVDLALNSMDPGLFSGGVFVLGYYQDDLATQAINYSNFNWSVGECGTCGTNYHNIWKSIRNHYFVYPIYVAAGDFEFGEMFDLKKAQFSNDTSWGMNLRLSVHCDLTDFFVRNRLAFKSLLGLKTAWLILGDMKVSQETNHVQENLRDIAIREIEADRDTKSFAIARQYNDELAAVSFNISGINSRCLGCEDSNYQPTIGVV